MFSKKAILFIHGFSAHYADNEYLLNYLQENSKIDVFTYTLPGHEKPIMSKVNYQNWIEKSEEQLNNIIKKYNTVYLIGHSMGGVIASYFASKYHQNIKKLILVAPGFKVGNLNQVKQDLFSLIKRENKYETHGFEGFLTKFLLIPKRRFKQLKLLVDNYSNYIYSVKCPILFLHGEIDNIVPYQKTVDTYNKITSEKWITIISGVRHKMFVTSKKELISSYILNYINGGLNWMKVRKEKL